MQIVGLAGAAAIEALEKEFGIVIEATSQFQEARQLIRKLFQSGSPDCRLVKVKKNDYVYTCGERDSMIYSLESGQVKEMLISPEGKECLIAIHAAGDIFGELSLCGQDLRFETTVAMQDCTIRRIPSAAFMRQLERASLLNSLVQYLALRIADQQEVITTLLTVNSEQRLAKTLLRLARKIGLDDARGKRLTHRLHHTELAEMVGTTRSRIGFFLKRFRELGLVDLGSDHSLLIIERKLAQYIEQFEFPFGRDIVSIDPEETAVAKPLALVS